MNKKFPYLRWAFFALCGLLLGGLYWALNSPYYALMQAGRSLASHDLAGFEKFVDVNLLTVSSLQQIIATAEAYPVLQEQIDLPLLKQEQAHITGIVNQLARTFIERGELDAALLQELDSLSSGSLPQLTIDPSQIEWKIEKNGSAEARFTVFIPTSYGIKVPLKFKMLRTGGNWQVTEIVELDKVLQPMLTLQSLLP